MSKRFGTLCAAAITIAVSSWGGGRACGPSVSAIARCTSTAASTSGAGRALLTSKSSTNGSSVFAYSISSRVAPRKLRSSPFAAAGSVPNPSSFPIGDARSASDLSAAPAGLEGSSPDPSASPIGELNFRSDSPVAARAASARSKKAERASTFRRVAASLSSILRRSAASSAAESDRWPTGAPERRQKALLGGLRASLAAGTALSSASTAAASALSMSSSAALSRSSASGGSASPIGSSARSAGEDAAEKAAPWRACCMRTTQGRRHSGSAAASLCAWRYSTVSRLSGAMPHSFGSKPAEKSTCRRMSSSRSGSACASSPAGISFTSS